MNTLKAMFTAFRKMAILIMMAVLFIGMSSCAIDAGNIPSNSVVPTAKEVVKDMANGFNLGNTFDNGINTTNPSTIYPIIQLFHAAGMKHIRIPVTWMDVFSSKLADSNGKVNFQHARFIELKAVIDYALGLDMYVVINAHHEHWLKDYYDGSASMDAKFAKLWGDIATYFKDYDHHLIFEVLNEPEGTLGEYSSNGSWPSPTNTTAIAYTRKVNKVGYNAIRETGGLNETRIIMVSVNGQGNESYLDEVYPSKSLLPGEGSDNYLAIQVHSYNPWAFCGQTGSNSAYQGNVSVQGAIQTIANHAKILDVPINYGEFGVGRNANASERNTDLVRGYYRTFAQKTLASNMSYSVWDDRGWFGLIRIDASGNYSFTNNIVPNMLQ